MCGRYTLEDVEELGEYYGLPLPAGVKPNYNTAPTQVMPVVTSGADGRQFELMKWGFRPFWMKDKPGGYSLFNARSEDAFAKSTWSKAIKERRCIIPASAFYEWKKLDGSKIPFYIYPKDRHYLSLAGVWGSFEIDGEKRECFSILTTSPNKEMSAIHDRMPVILHRADEAAWLNPDLHEPDEISNYLLPLEDNALALVEATKDINNVRNNSAELIPPLNSK